ncbi:MAG: response regulator transcription factor, partial [Sediminibacterium sp.]|nr:response regulator transcription factor [Sediminibacterium sp.]
MTKKILLIEDEKNLHKSIQLNLEMEGFWVDSAYTGEEGLKKILHNNYDVAILDLMLPNISGFEIIDLAKFNNIQTPILILSAKSNTSDKIIGLKKGADDYLTKPFDFEELLIRLKKIMYRSSDLTSKRDEFDYNFNGHLVFVYDFKVINKWGIEYILSTKEMLVLKLFIENENNILSREKITQTVWGYNVFNSFRTIDNFVLNFRKYFEEDRKNPKNFISIRSIG